MAQKKTNPFIEYEIGWLEEKFSELKQYVDQNPFHLLKDRFDMKETKNGGTIRMVVATVEQQVKTLKDILKDMPVMIEALGKLRERAVEIEMRGGGKVQGLAGRLLTGE